jgi:predicted  nucleic acid-binding Zn-ribbon protein
MEQELMALSDRIARLKEIMGQLHEENSRLKADLAFSQRSLSQQQERMAQARGKVEAALARLPMTDEA